MRRRSYNPGNPVAFERTTVQTLLFPKDVFTVASARAWAKQHNFRAPKVDAGSARATRLRVRQREPSAFQKGSFRTILLDHARGVEAVIGAPLRRNPLTDAEENKEIKRTLSKELPGWKLSVRGKWNDVSVYAERVNTSAVPADQAANVFLRYGFISSNVLSKAVVSASGFRKAVRATMDLPL